MNSPQRGIYQPLTENAPAYNLDEQIDDEERSRLPLLIVVGMIVLAAFTGVVWLAYNQGVERGRSGSTLVIAPPEGPVRTAPTDANTGGDTEFTGLKVYNAPVSPDQEAKGSTLARETPPPDTALETPPPPVPVPPISEAPPIRLSQITPPAPPVAPPAQVKFAPPAAPEAAPPETKLAAPAVVAAQPKPAPAAVPAVTPAKIAASGGAVLQIGSYENAAIANAAWMRFKTRYGAAAGSNISEDVQRADLGARGVWYRLRVGPFADKAAAAQTCEKLKLQGATCFVTAP